MPTRGRTDNINVEDRSPDDILWFDPRTDTFVTVPRSWTVSWAVDDATVTMSAELQTKQFRCTSLVFDGAVTGNVVRSVSVPAMLAEVASHMAVPVQFWMSVDGQKEYMPVGSVGDWAAEMWLPKDTFRPRQQKWTRLTDEYLVEVADVYREALAEGRSPTKSVAEHFTLSSSQARHHVERARRDGHLEPVASTAPDVPRSARLLPVTDEHLRGVADVYLGAVERGEPPVKAVAERFDLTRPTAGRHVQRARAAGYLPAADRGGK